ncbi:MAG: hypothetical protein ACI9IV_002028 [Paracoccaceae bacterium]|jgi:hypothetical protein
MGIYSHAIGAGIGRAWGYFGNVQGWCPVSVNILKVFLKSAFQAGFSIAAPAS